MPPGGGSNTTYLTLDGGTSATSTTIVDADRIILNDNGTMKQVAVSDLNTYTSSTIAADDVSVGDAAVNITTSSGNITIDTAAGDADIIFKGTDGSSDITALTLDMSADGAAIFKSSIAAVSLDISGAIDVDGTTNLDIVDIDGAVNIAADVTIASTNKIIFNDASQFIQGASNAILDIAATDEIELTATLIEIVGNSTVSGTLGVTGVLTGTSLDISGAIDVDGTTNLDVVDIDGAVDMASTLQVDGAITGSSTIQGTTITATTAFVPDASGGADLGTTALEFNDAFFNDGAVINFGDDQDTTLTHTDGTGLTLNSTNKLCFNDASQYIQGASNAILDIAATDEIELTATLIEIVGNSTVSGTLGVTGVTTSNAGVVVDEMTLDADTLTATDDFIVDAAGDITLDAGGGNVKVSVGGTQILDIANSSSDVIIKPVVDAKDIIFQQRDGTEVMRVEDGAHVSFAAAAVNPEATLSDGANVAWNTLTSPVAKLTLGGNRALSAGSGGVTGQFVSLLVIQDGTGSRTLTFNAVYEFAANTAPTLTTTANLGDLFVFRYNGAKYLEVGRNLALVLS